MAPKKLPFLLPSLGAAGSLVAHLPVNPDYKVMLQAIGHRLGVNSENLTLVVNVTVSQNVVEATVDPETWPQCLENATGAVVVRVHPARPTMPPPNPTTVPTRPPSYPRPVRPPGPASPPSCETNGDGEAKPEKMIKVVVQTLNRKQIPVDLALSSTVAQLKAAVTAAEGTPERQQRLFYNGRLIMNDTATLAVLGISDGAVVSLVMGLRKPVIYLMPPEPTDMVVKLALSPQWLFSAVYPPTTIVKDKVERIEWRVKANPNGRMTDDRASRLPTCSGRLSPDAQRTRWRKVPSTQAAHTSAPRMLFFSPHQTCQGTCTASCPSWAWTPAPAPTSSRTLHPESDDSRYWLADLNAHQNIALRFVPQKEYARAAPLETEPAADVVTRVFMLFRGVSTAEANDEMHWASVQQEVNWASIVGIDPRIGDANLLRVLEWGGMEVV